MIDAIECNLANHRPHSHRFDLLVPMYRSRILGIGMRRICAIANTAHVSMRLSTLSHQPYNWQARIHQIPSSACFAQEMPLQAGRCIIS